MIVVGLTGGIGAGKSTFAGRLAGIVEAPEDLRLERLIGLGLSAEDARARMHAQTSEDHRRAIADFVVDNAGPLGGG